MAGSVVEQANLLNHTGNEPTGYCQRVPGYLFLGTPTTCALIHASGARKRLTPGQSQFQPPPFAPDGGCLQIPDIPAALLFRCWGTFPLRAPAQSWKAIKAHMRQIGFATTPRAEPGLLRRWPEPRPGAPILSDRRCCVGQIQEALVKFLIHLHRRDLDFEGDDRGNQPFDIARRRHGGLPDGTIPHSRILRLDLRRQIISVAAKEVEIINDLDDPSHSDLLVIIHRSVGSIRSPVW